MSIEKAIKNANEGKLEQMRENFYAALSQKAAEKLQEKKLEIAQSYFAKK